jgi:hypothetical protein
VKQEDKHILVELKGTLEKPHKVFQQIPKWIPPSRAHEHKIEFISTLPNKRPYKYPNKKKKKTGEIEKMVQDMLNASII